MAVTVSHNFTDGRCFRPHNTTGYFMCGWLLGNISLKPFPHYGLWHANRSTAFWLWNYTGGVFGHKTENHWLRLRLSSSWTFLWLISIIHTITSLVRCQLWQYGGVKSSKKALELAFRYWFFPWCAMAAVLKCVMSIQWCILSFP